MNVFTKIRWFVVPPRIWEPTGETRLHYDEGGTASLDGEQRDRLSGKTRWITVRWMPIDDYRKRVWQLLDQEVQEAEIRRREKRARRNAKVNRQFREMNARRFQ